MGGTGVLFVFHRRCEFDDRGLMSTLLCGHCSGLDLALGLVG